MTIQLRVANQEGICEYCNEKLPDVRKRRLNTAYSDESANWAYSCITCIRLVNKYYEEMWAEYYASQR